MIPLKRTSSNIQLSLNAALYRVMCPKKGRQDAKNPTKQQGEEEKKVEKGAAYDRLTACPNTVGSLGRRRVWPRLPAPHCTLRHRLYKMI